MRIYDIILKKRNGFELTKEEIDFFIKGYTEGSIPDYQASALLMAILFKGMTDDETAFLTMAMAESGDTLDLIKHFGDSSVDKHSTGGVGDKTSLIVAPIVASLGGCVAKMSGRGLGHTGGTVDKLEAIPGYQINLLMEQFIKQSEDVGVAIIGQTRNLAPADKKLYALRDVTATVDSIPLIVSSIMSKKLASGAKSIVLDVKMGSGAFMKTPEDAFVLAEKMVEIGKKCGRNMAALITNMDTPLGNNIGNSLEIIEAVEILKNQKECDLKTVSVALAENMVALVKNISVEEARQQVLDAIKSGAAFEKMKQWIKAQGGDIRYLEDTALFERTKYAVDIISEKEGYIRTDSEGIGVCACILGAGRKSKEDTIDLTAGIIINKKAGDYVLKGEKLCTLYTNDINAIENAKAKYLSSLEFLNEKPQPQQLIYKIVK